MVHFVVVDLSWLAAQNWHYQDPTSHTIPTRGCQHNAV
jgi:predicted AlkP superfamily phosphohydrolase/phosphomutase